MRINEITHEKGDFFVVKTKREIRSIYMKNINYLESDGRYIKMHINTGEEIRIIMNMAKALEQLNDNFIQMHRSYIVNFNAIERIANNQAILWDGTCIPVSRDRWKVLQEEYLMFVGL